MPDYLSVKEAVKYSGKSESTIKRLVKKVNRSLTMSVDGSDDPEMNRPVLKKEKLKNGKHRNLLLKTYLDNMYNDTGSSDPVSEQVKTPSSERVNGPNNEQVSLYRNELIGILKSQVEEKDKQIDRLIRSEEQTKMLLGDLQLKNRELLDATVSNKSKEKDSSLWIWLGVGVFGSIFGTIGYFVYSFLY